MKVLIWFVMLFLAGFLRVMIALAAPQAYGYNEVMQLNLTAAVITAVCIFAARELCRQWDLFRLKRNAGKEGVSPLQYVARRVAPEVIQELERMEEREDASIHAYLRSCRRQRLVTAPQAQILEEAYVKGMHRPAVPAHGGSKPVAAAEEPASAAPPGAWQAGGTQRHSNDPQRPPGKPHHGITTGSTVQIGKRRPRTLFCTVPPKRL